MPLTGAQRAARYYENHRDEKLAWMKEYYVRNREEIQTKNRNRARIKAAALRHQEPQTVVAAPPASPDGVAPGV